MNGITSFPKRGETTKKILEQVAAKYAREPVSKPQAIVPKDECPKCGKRVGRGKHMHIKNCKG
jgi:hypothetical protein